MFQSIYLPPFNAFHYFLEGQVHKDSNVGIMANVGKGRLVKVIFTKIHKISDACANSFGRYIMTAKCMKNIFTFYQSCYWKMVFVRKLRLIYSSTPQHYINLSAPTFLILFKNFLAPPPFKKEGRDYDSIWQNTKEIQ